MIERMSPHEKACTYTALLGRLLATFPEAQHWEIPDLPRSENLEPQYCTAVLRLLQLTKDDLLITDYSRRIAAAVLNFDSNPDNPVPLAGLEEEFALETAFVAIANCQFRNN